MYTGDYMSIFIRLLGPVDVRRHDTLTPIGAPKRRAMLSVLALSANRPVQLSTLAESLWGDSPPPSATMNLRSHAHALRTVVDGRLITHAGAYELQLDTDELDAALFASLADRGAAARAAGDVVGAVAAYGEALGLWRGVALHGVPRTTRLEAALTGLLDRRLAVFEDYCIARLAGGAASELVPDLRKHLASHPFRERAWEALMLAQYRSGDIPAALAAYAQAIDVLRDQLGLDPGPELADLHRAILARDPRLQLDVRTTRHTPFARTHRLRVRAPRTVRSYSERRMRLDSSPVARDANPRPR
jgi:DNA-binding SARP family transcriptional activator